MTITPTHSVPEPRRLAMALLVVVAVVLAITVPAPPARAADSVAGTGPAGSGLASSGPVVLAQDQTAMPATITATVIGIDATPVGALTITGHGGQHVTATAKGKPSRSVTAAAGTPAVIRRLTPGTRYTIRIGGRVVGTATPLGQVGPAAALKVQTTDTRGAVALTWTHTALRGEGARVSYDVLATPLLADGSDDTAGILSATATTTSTRIDKLDPTKRYRFTITPRNSASTGRSTTATMTGSLNDATSTPVTPPEPTPIPTPTTSTAPSSSTSGPSGPSTKTIWVCPTGYTETTTGACQKTLAYTYTTTPYTYHQEATGPAPILDTYGTTGACPADYNLEDYGVMGTYCRKYGAVPTKTVKDDTPAGYTDTGTAWTIKDPTPTGYTDDGTQWVATTAKVAKTVTT